MDLVDVNVLIYAFRRDSVRHAEYRDWLDRLVNGGAPFGMSDVVLAGFLRIVTSRRIYREPSRLDAALTFADALHAHPDCVTCQPGPRHWRLFTDLCRAADARAGLIHDAWLAALAIESGSEWVSTDREFARFPGLRWRHPLG